MTNTPNKITLTDVIADLIENDELGLLTYDGDVADLFTFEHTPRHYVMSYEKAADILGSGER